MGKHLVLFLILHAYFNVFGKQNQCIKKWDSITKSEVYEKVDSDPLPKDGLDILHRKIRNSVKIDSIPENTLSAKVGIAFIICPDGSISGERILYDNTYHVASQMFKAIEGIDWIAGSCNNQKVPVLYKLPLTVCFR